LRLISNKVTLRSYNYFLKFSYFYFFEKLVFLTMSKSAKFGKKTQGILGIKSPFNPSKVIVRAWSVECGAGSEKRERTRSRV
jgi:hypothetical protein